MSNLPCNEKGIGMVEVLIAIFLTTVGVLAVLSLQPAAWSTSGRADYLGRAGGILHRTLESNQARIMNPCTAVTEATTSATVLASDQGAALEGDAAFTVTTTVASVGTNAWRLTVRVTWAGNATGITESVVVTRQERFRFPAGCPNA